MSKSNLMTIFAILASQFVSYAVAQVAPCTQGNAFLTPFETFLSHSSSTPACKEYYAGPMGSTMLILLGITNNNLACGSTSDILILDENRNLLHSFCQEKAITNVPNGFYNYPGRFVIIQLVIKTSGSISTFMHFNLFNQVQLSG